MKVELASQPDNAKVWVYQSSLELTDSDLKQIKEVGDFFLGQWESHNLPVNGYIDVYNNRFIVISAFSDEDAMCGKAQDSQMRLIKELEEVVEGKLTDRMLVFYQEENELKSFHLKYLVHLVGDIHQPLHVGRFEDRGGNDIKINFLGKASNLHRVWDSQMIEYYKLDYKSLADELIINKKIKVSINPIDWSYESHQKVKKIYSEIIGIDNINPDYIAINSPFIKSQLHKAGLTLAKVLNDVFK